VPRPPDLFPQIAPDNPPIIFWQLLLVLKSLYLAILSTVKEGVSVELFKTTLGLGSYLEDQRQGKTMGLVPTMGALHFAHRSLIERAVAENDLVVVSIFVNPLQFAPNEDLNCYPRQLEEDCRFCEELGVDVVFAPSIEEIYPQDRVTQIIPPPALTSGLCGRFRPGHFVGVATIVTKLLNIVQPTRAYFGEKDAQQLAIIRRLVTDLHLPVVIRACPLIREDSGLAYSSRNQYLTPEEKILALGLSRGLFLAQKAFHTNPEINGETLVNLVQGELGGLEVEYVELVHPNTLQPLSKVEKVGLLAAAVKVGTTRLIDNVILHLPSPIITIDGPAGAGKSTVTCRVAQILGMLYLDTGAMYRAVTWLAMEKGVQIEDKGAIGELVSQAKLELIPREDKIGVKINGEDVTEAIRTPAVTANVSTIAAQPAVRRKLLKQQQEWGEKGVGVVAEGRDMGTHVFPNAALKIFLTASVEERARRRWKQLQESEEPGVTIVELISQIQERDDQDSNRQEAPLIQALDAIVINTDNMTIDAVTTQIIQLYREKI